MSVSTLDGGTKVFFSRRLQEQQAGEDLIEKQNAEQGLMPIVGNEAAEYGYENENRAFTRCVSRRRPARAELPRRPRRDRAADGVLHERGRGAGDRMETVEPAIVRAAAGQAISRRRVWRGRGSGLAVSLSRRSLGEGGFQRVRGHVRRPELQLSRSLARRCDRRHAEARTCAAASCGRRTSSRATCRARNCGAGAKPCRSTRSIASAISSPRRRSRSRPTTSASPTAFRTPRSSARSR